MIWLVLALLLWIYARLFKRVLPAQRAAMGKRGLGVVAVMVLAGNIPPVIDMRYGAP